MAKIGVDTAENEPRKEWCVASDCDASQAIVVGGGLAGVSAANTILEHGAMLRFSWVALRVTMNLRRSVLGWINADLDKAFFKIYYFLKIYKIFTILRRSNLKIRQNVVKNFVIFKKIK